MNSMTTRVAVGCLLVGMLLLGGCVFNPWAPPPVFPIAPGNLLINGGADNNGLGWYFSSPDAIIDTGYSINPTFGIRNDAFLRQTVDLGIPLTGYVVVMSETSAETIGPTGVGRIWGDFIDLVDPQLVVGTFDSPDLTGTAVFPHQLALLTDYFLIPNDVGAIVLYLANTEVQGVPHDGSLTFFDDVELWIVETEQEAIQLIADYKAARMP